MVVPRLRAQSSFDPPVRGGSFATPMLMNVTDVTSSDAPSGGVHVGVLIRDARQRLGITLAELARRAGCARSYISSIETGRRGPPAPALISRIEESLGLPRGRLTEAAAWEQTPAPVRRDFTRLAESSRAMNRLAALVRGKGLDEAYASGELARLIDRMSPPEPAPVALPLEVPVINRVQAGYPSDFTDLGFPARVADEYVRCPDLRDADAFAARVVGDSMEPDYRAGDVVVFSPARAIDSGTDCFVRLEPDHETTFKRVFFDDDGEGGHRIRLQPINPKYPPTVLERESVAGLYRAVHLLRSV